MNWHEDWDYGPNTTGWDDGRCHGMHGTSAAILPNAATNTVRRSLLVTLILAGLAGGAFQAIQCARIVGQVVNSSPAHTTANDPPVRMKHVRFATEGAKAWPHR